MDEITADDYELAEAALASSDSEAAALRMLRDECGWTLRRGLTVIRLIRLIQGADASHGVKAKMP